MIYVSVDGEAQGPFSPEELSSLWTAGEIPGDALCWHRALRGWVRVSEFRPLVGTPVTADDSIVLTTTETVTRRDIEQELEIVTAECVIGMNMWKDVLAAFTDAFGGRSETTQNALRRARQTCLAELRREAFLVRADAVVGVRLSYSEMSGQGKSMLFLVASGTAVRLGPPPIR